jgi:hypothetical protein
MSALLLHGAISVLIAAASLTAYDHWVVRPALRVGIVDVGEVYRQKEAEFTLILTKAVSDDERQKAMLMARRFAQRLPAALDELPRECGCLVVLKSAVAGATPRAVDLTAHLKLKVEERPVAVRGEAP